MSRKLLVILVVFGLLVGNLTHVPIARATTWYNFTTAPTYMQINHYGDGSYRVGLWCDGAWVGNYWNLGATQNQTYSFFCSVGMTSTGGGFDWLSTGNYDLCAVFGSTSEVIGDGQYHEVQIACSGDYAGVGKGWTWNWSGFINVPVVALGATWTGSPDTQEAPVPLAVTIDSGPTSVDLVNGGTWHAAATGGATPYTYYWDWMILGGTYHYNTPFDPVGPTGSDTYSHTWPTAGTYVLECMVRDADGTWADATYQVSAASVIGSYHALFARYGDKGQYLNVQVDDAAGNPVTISSTAGTRYGLYEAGGAFGWFAADNEAAQLVTYTWRWVMGYTVTPPGLSLPPPADFWIETSIHLAVPNIDLQVTHHFTSLSETLDPWYGPGGDPQVPETPPAETSTLPVWLQPVYDMFMRLLRFLFVPSASDFSAQLASGWLLIASPVPSITPQYTIPFPNPNHLLAPTGDSVNIDFSVVQGYAGYSIMHTIVQVLMYAILVFIVIGIIT